jgi:nucleotide-binding universal stress UspA family protein
VRLTNRYDANFSSSAFVVADAHYQEVVDRRKQLDRKCFIIEPD